MESFLLIDDPSCEGIPSLSDSPIAADLASSLRVVAVGGGTGTSMTLRALRALGLAPDAVVAMADDGGSTGLLRSLDDMTPPGDIRKCLVALAEKPECPLVRAFAGRMPDVENHALGNLLLAGLEDACGSFPDAIALCEELLSACGHVYPSTLEHVHFAGLNEDGEVIFGQHDACISPSALKNARLVCDGGAPTAYEPAMHALSLADVIVLGPGSLFTSVIPNLLVPGISEAINASNGHVVFVCSLFDTQGETRGFALRDYFDAIERFGLRGRIDFVIAQDSSLLTGNYVSLKSEPIEAVHATDDNAQLIAERGSKLLLRDLSDARFPWRHDVAKLANALAEVIGACRSRQM